MIKKLTLLGIIISSLLVTVGVFDSPIKAETVSDQYGYTFACGLGFEVDDITDDGNFKSVGCFNTLQEAKVKMKENDDYVVRYYYGRSPMRIVAMNAGLAYAYPKRVGNDTLNVYLNSDETGLKTYTSQFREMVYYDTTYINDKSENYKGYGILKVNLNGFDGYTDLEAVDLIPFKFIDKKIPCYTGVNSSSAQKFIIDQNYFIAKNNKGSNDLFINYAISSKHPMADDSTQSGEFVIGKAPSFMELNKKYYSADGVNFYSDNHLTKFVGTNYNYFQFLSIRSKANLTAKDINNYLEKLGKTNSAFYGDNAQKFIDGQNKYGMNALLIFALACNESAYGTKLINKNNIFGLGAYDGKEAESAFGYTSIEACINDLMGWHLAKYCDYYGEGHFYTAPYFGNKGIGIQLKYAADPYECYIVANIAYNIDKFISGSGSLKNYDAYDLAYVKDTNVKFKAQANDNSETLYKSQAGYYQDYQKFNVVTVLGQEGNFAKVISGNPIDENRKVVKTVSGYTTYDSDLSYAYVSIDHLLPLNNSKMFNNFGDYSYEVNDISWDNELLHLKAISQTENLIDDTKMYLSFVSDKPVKYEINSLSSDDEVIADGSIDIKDLPVGNYDIMLETQYLNNQAYSKANKVEYDTLPELKIINEKVYSFRIENNYLRLYVSSAPKDFESLLVLNDLKLQKNKTNNHAELVIDGIGAIRGLDSLISGDTVHQLVLYNISDPNASIFIDLDNKEGFYSLNDGHKYKEVGFEGTIDIDSLLEYPLGSYSLGIKTTNSGNSSIALINTMLTSFSNQTLKSSDGNHLYRIIVDDMNSNRVNLNIENVYEEIDYSSIQKMNYRTSFNYINSIDFVEDDSIKVLKINAAVMMYMLDYSVSDNVNYNVYLIDDINNNLIKMDTVKVDNSLNFKEITKSSYNMDHISFEAKIPVSVIQKGNYRIVVEITNTNNKKLYKDYVDLAEKFIGNYNTLDENDLHYEIVSSKVRYQLILKVD